MSKHRDALPVLVALCRAADPACGVMLQGSVSRGTEGEHSDVDLTIVLRDSCEPAFNELVAATNHGAMIRVFVESVQLPVDVNWVHSSELLDRVARVGAADWFMFSRGEILHDPLGLAAGCQARIRRWFAENPLVAAAWQEQQAAVEAHRKDPTRVLKFPTQPEFCRHLALEHHPRAPGSG